VLPEEVEDDGTLQLAEEKRKRKKRSKRVMNLAHVVEDRELFICETERNRGGRKKKVMLVKVMGKRWREV